MISKSLRPNHHAGAGTAANWGSSGASTSTRSSSDVAVLLSSSPRGSTSTSDEDVGSPPASLFPRPLPPAAAPPAEELPALRSCGDPLLRSAALDVVVLFPPEQEPLPAATATWEAAAPPVPTEAETVGATLEAPPVGRLPPPTDAAPPLLFELFFGFSISSGVVMSGGESLSVDGVDRKLEEPAVSGDPALVKAGGVEQRVMNSVRRCPPEIRCLDGGG